ncbi:cyclic nucleotide-binding domain-containing protein, partial [bacterium]|nr:cyclic nucleotide-binding domain-containing protein [bacterium]MBU1916764.1 cyclic nucleotide-binding domain-containing protein [bacterium]
MGKEKSTILDKAVFFDELPEKIKKAFYQTATTKIFKDGHTLIQKGDISQFLFLIIKGRVSIIRTDQDSDEILKYLGTSDVFGTGIILNRSEAAKFEAKQNI